ncbi:hypothetical protein XELAEV_18038843mg [Xenopus laevis]|uniref:Uncharacterized protein n=1 Tax=Xenopus laevis TaxID=8355 RepID=A0A974C7X2_XENLA|nr:hypothetical protein XELAEV_18038843mg [Xenopus laevis]
MLSVQPRLTKLSALGGSTAGRGGLVSWAHAPDLTGHRLGKLFTQYICVCVRSIYSHKSVTFARDKGNRLPVLWES